MKVGLLTPFFFHSKLNVQTNLFIGIDLSPTPFHQFLSQSIISLQLTRKIENKIIVVFRSIRSNRLSLHILLPIYTFFHPIFSSRAAKDDAPQNSEDSSPDEPSEDSTNIVRWIFDNTKTKVMEVIDRITELMNHLFENGNHDGDNKKRGGEGWDILEEKIRSSFLISIVVLLVVMISRTHNASQ